MSNPLTDRQLLLKCRKLIAEKLSWPPAAEWTEAHYNELRNKILETTGVGLSTDTLQSLFGTGEHTDDLPVLNPVANFLGFQNWQHFKSDQSIPTSPLGALMGRQTDRRKLRNMNVFFVGVALLAMIILYVFFFARK